jgi:phosphatidylglycerophosphate synthase
MKYFSSNLELIRKELEYFGFWTWANIITTGRLVMAIFALYFLLAGILPTLTFLFLLASSALDAGDGWVARRYNCKTIIGGLYDKITDKILIGATLGIMLLLLIGFLAPEFNAVFPQVSIGWITYLILAEIALFSLGLLSLWFPLIPTGAGSVGKWKMICECIFILFCYFAYLRPFGIGFDDLNRAAQLGNYLLKISFWLAIGSGLQYGIRGLKNYRFAEKVSGR